MPSKKHKQVEVHHHEHKEKEIDIPSTNNDAMKYIAFGIMYYLKHHFKKTVITILIVCGAALYTVISLSEKGYSIKEVKPTTAGLVNPIGSTFSLMPQLYASNLGGELIQFGGKSYPFAKDTTYEFAKILGEPGILVWNKHLNKVFRIHIPELDDSALRKYAK